MIKEETINSLILEACKSRISITTATKGIMELFPDESPPDGRRSAPSDGSGNCVSGDRKGTFDTSEKIDGVELATSDPARSGCQARSAEENERNAKFVREVTEAYEAYQERADNFFDHPTEENKINLGAAKCRLLVFVKLGIMADKEANRRNSDGERSEHRGPERPS